MNISQAKTILTRKFAGASLDDVQGISDYTVFEEAAMVLLTYLDPIESKRTAEINLFNEIYDYTIPDDLKGNKVIDLRPQSGRRTSSDGPRQVFTKEFDREKEETDDRISVQFDDGVKFIRINESVSNSMTVTSVETSDYTAGVGVSNIAEDTIMDLGDGKSLRFDISSGSNLLTWVGTAVDLDAHELRSSLFLEVYWPDSSIITSLTLRIGSSPTDYYEITGALQIGSIRTGKNTYVFNWNGATQTGTVDEANIDYVRYAIVATSADTDIRIGRLSSKLPAPYEMPYYSKALFRPAAGGAWLTIPTSETDIINLDTDGVNIFLAECEIIIASDLQRTAEMAKFHGVVGRDLATGLPTGGGLYGKYKVDKPSEAIKPNVQWYKPPTGRCRSLRIRRY